MIFLSLPLVGKRVQIPLCLILLLLPVGSCVSEYSIATGFDLFA